MRIAISIAFTFVLFMIMPHLIPLPMGNMVFVSGQVKSGKTTFAVWLAKSRYRQKLLVYYATWLFHVKHPKEKPLFYSNIPVRGRYVPLTTDLLSRRTRFRYGSVIFIDEASLFADSMAWRDMEVNERLLLFNKLIAHETHGGFLVYNSQAVDDMHYAVKRCLSNFLFVEKTIKCIPFILICSVTRKNYSAENTSTVDPTSETHWFVFSKRIWKYFDRYAFSTWTDDLPVDDSVVDGRKSSDLKARSIPALRKFITIEVNKNEKDT